MSIELKQQTSKVGRPGQAARAALARLVPAPLARVPGRLLARVECAVARAEARLAAAVLNDSGKDFGNDLGAVARAARALLRVERARWRLWLRDAAARLRAERLVSADARRRLAGELGGPEAMARWERGAARVRARVAAGSWERVEDVRGKRTPDPSPVRPLAPLPALDGAGEPDVEFRFRLAALPRRRARAAGQIMGQVRGMLRRAQGVARGVARVKTVWVEVWPEELREAVRERAQMRFGERRETVKMGQVDSGGVKLVPP